MRHTLLIFACILSVASSYTSDAQTLTVNLVSAFRKLSFSQITDIQNAGDRSNRLFVCEKEGLIKVFEGNPDIDTSYVFLDLSDRVVSLSEMGLLGVAFHPHYEENGYFYVNYNTRQNDSLWTVISRWSVDSGNRNRADSSSELVLMRFYQPYTNHNGGQLSFGPDGYLYIATGDGGASGDPFNFSQSMETLLGKILRIDVNNPDEGMNYGIPQENPFDGHAEYRNEIYAYGLRNPWRFSFDSETGRIWTGDVGQNRYEEIDIIEKGGNYGWRLMEGWHCFAPRVDCDSTDLKGPVWEYPHKDGNLSITGGYVYRGSDVPELTGLYIYGDFVSGRIWGLEYDPARQMVMKNIPLADADFPISTFGVDKRNELYIGDFSGSIYKFEIESSMEMRENELSDAILQDIRPGEAAERIVIPYYVAKRTNIVVGIFDRLGNEVTLLVDREHGPGDYVVEFDTAELVESVYYCRLTTKEGSMSRIFTIAR